MANITETSRQIVEKQWENIGAVSPATDTQQKKNAWMTDEILQVVKEDYIKTEMEVKYKEANRDINRMINEAKNE